jgi:hypothetical protein
MTEPQGGADTRVFTTTAERDSDHWVINGEKWFSSNARYAEFVLVLTVTDPEAPIQKRMSMFIVPRETEGLEMIRNVPYMGERLEQDKATEGYLRYNNVRVPLDHMLGEQGGGFAVAQARWRERFGVRNPVGGAGFGLTECAIVTMLPFGDPYKPNCAGKRCDSFDIRVVDDNNAELPYGTPGELIVRPLKPHVMFEGYWNRPADTLKVMRNM